MHWLLLLSILASTTGVKSGTDTNSANTLVANAIRQRLGGARNVQVQLAPSSSRAAGDFDRIVVNLDGFNADRLQSLADGSSTSNYPDSNYPSGDGQNGAYGSDGKPNIYPPDDISFLKARSLGRDDIGDILGGVLGGGIGSGGDIGNILGGFLKGGRIGRLQFTATNFSFGGATYDRLGADLGEIRFDWAKALRGQMDVKSVQPGTLALSLRADQAAKLLSPRLPQLQDLKVSFRDGRAFLGAKSNFYGLKVPFEVGASISVTQNQVIANNWQASLANVRVPGMVLNEITQRANPLYDFDPQRRWPIAVDLQTAGTSNNALALRGGLRWLVLNRRDEPQHSPPPAEKRDSGDIFDIFGN